MVEHIPANFAQKKIVQLSVLFMELSKISYFSKTPPNCGSIPLRWGRRNTIQTGHSALPVNHTKGIALCDESFNEIRYSKALPLCHHYPYA